MNGSLRVKDRLTFEEGRLFQSLKTGWVKVLMDNGEVREYLPKDLIATISSGQHRFSSAGSASKVLK